MIDMNVATFSGKTSMPKRTIRLTNAMLFAVAVLLAPNAGQVMAQTSYQIVPANRSIGDRNPPTTRPSVVSGRIGSQRQSQSIGRPATSLPVRYRLTDNRRGLFRLQDQDDQQGDGAFDLMNEEDEKAAEAPAKDADSSDSDDLETSETDDMIEDDQESSSDEPEGNNLIDKIPVGNLYGGIAHNSMQRTVYKRDIANPNTSFNGMLQAAPTVANGCSVKYKTWESPNVAYRPLYFEDENLERYGNHKGNLQPLVSGYKFASTVLTLPYRVQANGASGSQCEYGLGYYRPGNCNPAHKTSLVKSGRGAAAQILVVGIILAGL
jgi:hypothetical protein